MIKQKRKFQIYISQVQVIHFLFPIENIYLRALDMLCYRKENIAVLNKIYRLIPASLFPIQKCPLSNRRRKVFFSLSIYVSCEIYILYKN